MTYKELETLVAQGEHQYLEFKIKAAFPEKVVREMAAFANTDGGRLLIGVDDDKTILGVKYPEEEAFSISQALEKLCRPKLNFRFIEVKVSRKRSVLVYIISESRKRPHYINENAGDKGTVYHRKDDRSIKASRELIEIMKRQRRNKGVTIRYGEKEKILMEYLNANDKITLDKYREIARLNRLQASKTLVSLVMANVIKIQPREREDLYHLNLT